MSGRTAEELIDRLVTDLAPVRRIPSLLLQLALVLAVAGGVACAAFWLYPAQSGLGAVIASEPAYASVLVGLVLAVLGGCVGALASAVPGRDVLARGGLAVAVVGLALALGVTAVAAPWTTVAPVGWPCLMRGAVLALVPVGMALWVCARGWSGRPALTVGLALLGGGAIGALLVHLSCPALEPLHLLCTHVAAPVLLAVLLTAALAPVMRRAAR